ncbi:ISL3 family transposase, partial [Candidatus Woesearchaeota archaeon]|nr:ISL3 family transposase [Candidatus Woesearchaeota archaeon]
MSHTNSILNLLNIKDENITFGENWLTEEQIGVTFVKVFHGTLTYIPDACHNCGTIFDSNIIKYGFKISRIKLPSVSRFSSYLSLKKQRYLCKHCSSTFVLPTSLVRKNCFISNNTKLAIAIDIKEKVSEKDLALRHNVSHSTVSRIVDRSFYDYKPNFNHLPENLCFDEFKSVKSAAGAMSFIFCNADTHSIIDIVEDRRLHVLKKYFQNYKLETRNQVKRIVIDMYSPYMTLIKELFPKALIIIDKFHMVQLLSRAFNKTRIKIMNNDQKNYNKLKRYWRLLLKNSSEINHQDYFYRRCFKRRMTDF